MRTIVVLQGTDDCSSAYMIRLEGQRRQQKGNAEVVTVLYLQPSFLAYRQPSACEQLRTKREMSETSIKLKSAGPARKKCITNDHLHTPTRSSIQTCAKTHVKQAYTNINNNAFSDILPNRRQNKLLIKMSRDYQCRFVGR